MVSNIPNQQKFQHWKIERDCSDILWLRCDRQGESTNTLDEAVITELGLILEQALKNKPIGIGILSAKESGFVAGADIREFENFEKAQDVTNKILQGHKVFAQLESMDCPTVAAVAGFCLGGGLELALCCDYIIAQDRPDTRIGLPEVKLGIFPGLGGSVRLTERVGGLKALPLMLTGRLLRARPARAIGVIDQVVGIHDSLYWHARKAILQKRKSQGPGIIAKLSNTSLVRQVLASIMARQTRRKARPEHYPAPFRLIENWRRFQGNREQMFTAEAEGVGTLMVGETARNLRRVFYLMERLKGLGKQSDFKVKHVHVVGAGVMGGDIAAWCVVQGMEVSLQDRELQYIEPALKRAKALFKKRLRSKPLVNAAVARLTPDVDGFGVARADVIIEAIFEDLNAKRELYKNIEPRIKDGAVLATNTSAIPLELLASELDEPSRLIGLHFFNPVAKMLLVEVVEGEKSSAAAITKGSAFCTQINRFPLPVKSSPGFLVNRVLAPYLMEAMRCLKDDIDVYSIDEAAMRFGMPMGPVELADIVGLDVCLKVAETLSSDNVESERTLLQGMIGEGKLGKKSGQGFYTWKAGKAVKEKRSKFDIDLDVLANRLIQPFLDECAAVNEDKIVEDADLIDAGIIFGTGFAPFNGGPMNFIEQQGLRKL